MVLGVNVKETLTPGVRAALWYSKYDRLSSLRRIISWKNAPGELYPPNSRSSHIVICQNQSTKTKSGHQAYCARSCTTAISSLRRPELETEVQVSRQVYTITDALISMRPSRD